MVKEINKKQSYKITTLHTDYLASYVIYISPIGPRHRLGLGCRDCRERAGISTAIIVWPLANVRIEFANVRLGQYKSPAAGGAELASVPVSAGAEFCILSFGASRDQVLRRLVACPGSTMRDRNVSLRHLSTSHVLDIYYRPTLAIR